MSNPVSRNTSPTPTQSSDAALSSVSASIGGNSVGFSSCSSLRPIRRSESPKELFETNLAFYTREFKGQRAGQKIKSATITSSSIDSFLLDLFMEVRPLIKREIKVDGDVFTWSDNENLNMDDLQRFVLLAKAGRKNIDIDTVNLQTLQRWREQEVDVYVHVYSLSLQTLAKFKAAKKALIDPMEVDRSGAASLATVQAIVEDLKRVHKHNYVATAITWSMWANSICKAESHLQEAMKHDAPPEHLISLFTRAPTNADNVLHNIRTNFSVASTVNESLGNSISLLRPAVDQFKETAKMLTNLADDLDKRLKVCEQKFSSNTELLTASTEMVVEDTYAAQVFDGIGNQEDIDHAE